MNKEQRGWTTVALTVGKPTPDMPKGGEYNRLEKILLTRKEPWGDAVGRLLDFHDDIRPLLYRINKFRQREGETDGQVLERLIAFCESRMDDGK